jgi:phosphate uptake regulator
MDFMEIRRVQITGGSSYVMTLPKEWIKLSNIKKNDPLGIYVQSDGTLLITPKMSQSQKEKTKQFELKQITKRIYLLRELIAAYIAGYNSIEILSDTRITPSIRSTITEFTKSTIGQEVVEETDNSITIKDLLNPTEMPFNRTIKRMNIIVKGMNDDMIKALQTSDQELIERFIQRDNDVDRLHWLVARQHNTIIQNVSLAEKMNTTIELSLTFFLISRIIERIGDHVVKIAENVSQIVKKPINQNMIDKIENASSLSMSILNKSIAAFYRKDIKISNQNIDTVSELEKLCDEIDTLILKQSGILAISIGSIVDSIRRIGEYSQDISEHVINYLIRLK